MQEHGYRIDFVSRLLKKKVFQYSGDFYQFQTSKDNNVYEFKYRVKKINDIKMMIHTGDWKPVIFLEVELFDFDKNLDKTFKNLLLALRGSDNVNGLLDIVAKPTLWEMKHNIGSYLGATIGFDGTVSITNYDIQFKENKNINETKAHRLPIQKMIKDVVTILKKNQEGEFYLPEDINDEDYEYYLKNVSVTVELILEKSNDVDGFMLNANYYSDDDVIVVKIVYNPDNKVKSTYKLIGELNELISHELRHNYQKNTGMYELGGNTDDLTGYEYYTQDHELDAQYEGFKRMSKITRKPFEILVKDWFENNKDIHQMSDEDSKLVVDKILKLRP